MRPKILLVEDEQDIKLLYSAAFKNSPFDLIIVEDIEEAYLIALKDRPKMILLDLVLPRHRGESATYEQYLGFDLLKMLQKAPETRDLPTVVFSNLKEKEIEKKARELGAADFIVKSQVTPKELVAYIEEKLKK